MNKRLFLYCQKHFRLVDSAQLKANASLKQLTSDYNIGYIENGIYFFNARDKLNLIELVAQQLGGIRLSDPFPQHKSRIEIANHQRNEKSGAVNVTDGFVLLNSLNELCLNQQVTKNSDINSLGSFLCASEVITIEHSKIVLFENLIVMANLRRLNIPESLKDALWLYRGDVQTQQQTGTANQFFQRFKETNELICFSDFDPAGLQIALSCGAEKWLTLECVDDLKINLSGIEYEWFNQKNAITFINNYKKISDSISMLFSSMSQHQKTLKQEHMIEHSLSLMLYPII